MQCPQGGEAWRKLGVANDERGIIVIVLPLWLNGYRRPRKSIFLNLPGPLAMRCKPANTQTHDQH
jgi:hypothetical protein